MMSFDMRMGLQAVEDAKEGASTDD
jgi:hypothetical protein